MKQCKVKLDENLGQTHAEFLRQAGYYVQRVHEQGLSGKSDSEVWAKVCDEGYLFVTLDLDFADIRQYPLGAHHGIILLRPRSHGRQSVLEILKRLTNEYQLGSLCGCLVVADEVRIRVRRLARCCQGGGVKNGAGDDESVGGSETERNRGENG